MNRDASLARTYTLLGEVPHLRGLPDEQARDHNGDKHQGNGRHQHRHPATQRLGIPQVGPAPSMSGPDRLPSYAICNLHVNACPPYGRLLWVTVTVRVRHTGRVTLEDLIQRLRDFAAARDWEPYHTPKNLVMALSGEVGELTSLFQWLTPDEAKAWRDDPTLEANVLDEIADVTLYLVRLADVLGLDLFAAANAKIDRNELRFPALER